MKSSGSVWLTPDILGVAKIPENTPNPRNIAVIRSLTIYLIGGGLTANFLCAWNGTSLRPSSLHTSVLGLEADFLAVCCLTLGFPRTTSSFSLPLFNLTPTLPTSHFPSKFSNLFAGACFPLRFGAGFLVNFFWLQGEKKDSHELLLLLDSEVEYHEEELELKQRCIEFVLRQDWGEEGQLLTRREVLSTALLPRESSSDRSGLDRQITSISNSLVSSSNLIFLTGPESVSLDLLFPGDSCTKEAYRAFLKANSSAGSIPTISHDWIRKA